MNRAAPSFEPVMTGAGSAPAASRYPPGFDPAPFVEQAKLQFRKLQAAYDSGDRTALVGGDDARDVRGSRRATSPSARRTKPPRSSPARRRGDRRRDRGQAALDERALHRSAARGRHACSRRISTKCGISSSPSTARPAGCSPASSRRMKWPDPAQGPAAHRQPHAGRPVVGARQARRGRRPRVLACGRSIVGALAHRSRGPPRARAAGCGGRPSSHPVAACRCPRSLPIRRAGTSSCARKATPHLGRRAEGARAHDAVVRRGERSRKTLGPVAGPARRRCRAASARVSRIRSGAARAKRGQLRARRGRPARDRPGVPRSLRKAIDEVATRVDALAERVDALAPRVRPIR